MENANSFREFMLADAILLFAISLGFLAMASGLLLIAGGYFTPVGLRHRLIRPASFLDFERLEPPAKRLWRIGYALIVGGYLLCIVTTIVLSK